MSGEDSHLESDYEDKFAIDANDYDDFWYDVEDTCDDCGELYDDCECEDVGGPDAV